MQTIIAHTHVLRDNWCSLLRSSSRREHYSFVIPVNAHKVCPCIVKVDVASPPPPFVSIGALMSEWIMLLL